MFFYFLQLILIISDILTKIYKITIACFKPTISVGSTLTHVRYYLDDPVHLLVSCAELQKCDCNFVHQASQGINFNFPVNCVVIVVGGTCLRDCLTSVLLCLPCVWWISWERWKRAELVFCVSFSQFTRFRYFSSWIAYEIGCKFSHVLYLWLVVFFLAWSC